MTNMQYPWKIEKRQGMAGVTYEIVALDGAGFEIGVFKPYYSDNPQSDFIISLIAAAPELLEALEVALKADPNQANHSYYKRVISKAKGLSHE